MHVSFSHGVQGRAGNSIPTQGEEAGTAWAPHGEYTPTGANPTPSHLPMHIPAVLRPSSAHRPSPITRSHWTPMGPSCPHCRAECELEKRLLQLLPLLLPQPPAHDLFNPKLSSHKYTNSWQETCFSYTSPLLLKELFPASRAPCTSPHFFSPGSSEIFQARNKICCSTKSLKLPVRAQEAPRASGQASGAAVPPDLPAHRHKFFIIIIPF